jgi:NAD(P)-dependent dehydrogenase (short-subunit alcohol dehydrogenase family)
MKNYFITGISSGLGKAMAEEVMRAGDFVIGTFRRQEQVDAFNDRYAGKGRAVLVDVLQADQVAAAVDLVRDEYGRLDVLVNNAGYGFAGAVEEASEQEVREVFEVNVFGALRVTQAFLPMMRKQRSGHLLQISSHGGMKAFPGFGVYNAAKFALEGFSEALAAEVAPLGIKVTIVEPGPFRTGFAGASFQEAAKVIEDYQSTAGAFREKIRQVDGKQEGHPHKAAQAMIRIVGEEHPPLRLPLGKIALMTIGAKLKSVQEDLDRWRPVAEQAVYGE